MGRSCAIARASAFMLCVLQVFPATSRPFASLKAQDQPALRPFDRRSGSQLSCYAPSGRKRLSSRSERCPSRNPGSRPAAKDVCVEVALETRIVPRVCIMVLLKFSLYSASCLVGTKLPRWAHHPFCTSWNPRRTCTNFSSETDIHIVGCDANFSSNLRCT